MPTKRPVASGRRYLEGNFAPVSEELTVHELTVTGELPGYLDGRYLRIGPNPVTIPEGAYHWFLGDGMVHGVRLRGSRAEWYRNRWVRSPSVATALGETFEGDVGMSDFAPNTNVLEHAGRTLAFVEGGTLPYALTDELGTVGPFDFQGTLPSWLGRPGYSAHPHRDPDSGELHAVSYTWSRGNRVDYSVVDLSGRVRHSVDITVQGSPMMHDFALTEGHVVIFDLPVTFDIDLITRDMRGLQRRMARGLLRRIIGRNPLPQSVFDRFPAGSTQSGDTPMVMPYRWNPDYPARVGVMPREGDNADVRWFEINPCFVFHALNAYDEDGAVVVDVIRHPRMFAEHLDGPDEGPSVLTRFTLDLVSGRATEETIDDRPQEFPRLDERLTGKRHRYGYCLGVDGGDAAGLVLKQDLDARTTLVRALGHGLEASEFCFVADPDGLAEDDGVLMGFVFDAATERSHLRVLDAATLEDVAAG
ncbi:MAG TPA: carotenoid oxygenase, partial [Propionibacterium sp.]|nr:carotenoid oxygenase [Propionibacterium sp.]